MPRHFAPAPPAHSCQFIKPLRNLAQQHMLAQANTSCSARPSSTEQTDAHALSTAQRTGFAKRSRLASGPRHAPQLRPSMRGRAQSKSLEFCKRLIVARRHGRATLWDAPQLSHRTAANPARIAPSCDVFSPPLLASGRRGQLARTAAHVAAASCRWAFKWGRGPEGCCSRVRHAHRPCPL